MHGTRVNPLSSAEAMAYVIHAYRPNEILPEDRNELRGLYLSVLAGKRALMLLENAGNKEQIEPLLPPVGVAILITSRNRFALPGLKKIDLDILPPDKSSELLLKITERIGNRAQELAELCGYLSLALRNAASVLAEREDISVNEYERRLGSKKGDSNLLRPLLA